LQNGHLRILDLTFRLQLVGAVVILNAMRVISHHDPETYSPEFPNGHGRWKATSIVGGVSHALNRRFMVGKNSVHQTRHLVW
jgi:hypothetical protein